MGRSPCCDKTRVKRGPWSQEEDAILRSFVQRFGNAGNWIAMPQKAGLKRCGKSCRLRWLNYLRPELRHGGFTDEEDSLILSLYSEMGSKWSVIASRLPGRTDNDVKNYWNTKLKKRYDLDLASTGQGRISRPTPPSPPPAPAPSSDDSATADSQQAQQDDEPDSLPLTPPALTDLDTAFVDDTAAVDDDDMLVFKSEQLYAELVGLVEKQSQTTTTATAPSSTAGGDELLLAATTPASSCGTAIISPTVSSSGSSSTSLWPMDAHATALLSSESNSSTASATCSLFDAYGVGGDAFGAALPAAYSFLDLLASSSSYDDVTAAAVTTQELLYYQKY